MNARLFVLALFLGAFVANISNFAMSPFLAVIADDIGSSVALIGQIVTVSFIAGATIGLVIGPLGDHYGLRRMVIAGALLIVLSGIGSALAGGYWTLLISRIPAGVAGGMLLGLGTSLAATRLPEESRRGAIVWIASAGALSAVLGVPFMAMLADATSWRASFVVLGLLGFGLVWAYLRAVSPDPPVSSGRVEPMAIFVAYRDVLRDRVSVVLQLANLFWATAWIGMLTYMGAFLMAAHGLSLQGVGYLYMWGGALFFAGTRLSRLCLRFGTPFTLFVAAAAGMGVTIVAMFSLAPNVVVTMVFMGLLAVAGGIGLPTVTILISEAAVAGQGTVMMLRMFTWSLGSAAGAALGGVALARSGFDAVGAGLGLTSLVAATAVLLASRFT